MAREKSKYACSALLFATIQRSVKHHLLAVIVIPITEYLPVVLQLHQRYHRCDTLLAHRRYLLAYR